MSYFDEVYVSRANYYGTNLQSRIEGERIAEFEDYLSQSVYRVDFRFHGKTHPGALEPNKQDDTQTIQYLLTRLSLELPAGTLLHIGDKYWIVMWLEDIQASGYNRYTVIKATDELEDFGWVYFHGPGRTFIADTTKYSRFRYAEELSKYFMICPYIEGVNVEDYFEIEYRDSKKGFKITGIDWVSTPGLMYVSLQPSHLHDESAEQNSDYYWLEGN